MNVIVRSMLSCPVDDLVTSTGVVTSDPVEFGNSWLTFENGSEVSSCVSPWFDNHDSVSTG